MRDSLRFSPMMIAVAKGLIYQLAEKEQFCETLILSVLSKHRIWPPSQLIFHKMIDSTQGIRSVAECFSWRVACAEAINELIRSGYLVAIDKNVIKLQFYVKAIYGFEESSSHIAHLIFKDLTQQVPQRVRRGSSPAHDEEALLSEPDLYLQDLRITNLNELVKAALEEAVMCFRQDLFNAAAVMLGSATEGAWIDLGESLIAAVPAMDRESVNSQVKAIRNFRNGVISRINAIIALYDKQQLFAGIASSSGIKRPDLDKVKAWSNTVRDSRNTVHIGHQPDSPNTYDKVAELLLATPMKLRLLYSAKAAVDSLPRT